MVKKLEKDNISQLTEKANEIFEGVEITEEDFLEQFDNHLEKKPPMELRSNRDDLLALGATCNKYDPCPICYKCRVKGSHLYTKCDSCPIDLCIHTNANREMMIKRNNFSLEVGKDLVDALKELEQKHCSE